jgi:hypothetical protein
MLRPWVEVRERYWGMGNLLKNTIFNRKGREGRQGKAEEQKLQEALL